MLRQENYLENVNVDSNLLTEPLEYNISQDEYLIEDFQELEESEDLKWVSEIPDELDDDFEDDFGFDLKRVGTSGVERIKKKQSSYY